MMRKQADPPLFAVVERPPGADFLPHHAVHVEGVDVVQQFALPIHSSEDPDEGADASGAATASDRLIQQKRKSKTRSPE